jgi:CspA family cold shock protein
MIQILIAAATALLLGAFATELESRLFAGQYFATLVLTATVIFIGALVVRRSAAVVDAARRRDAVTTPAAVEQREAGRVKWFNRSKGFGFIIRDSGGEVFVHHRNIEGGGRRSLKDGERVLFNVAPHEKGLQAEQVSVLPER